MTNPTIPKTGRPKAPGSTGIAIEDSRIFAFLEERLPDFCVRNRLNVKKLAEAIDYSHQGIYHWFRKDYVGPAAAGKLVAIANGRFSMSDMVPFLLPLAK
jgi:hypothetical protein